MSIFRKVDIYHWTDQDFLFFCKEYVNPIFSRYIMNEKQGKRLNLQPNCVNAINQYLHNCGYHLTPKTLIGDPVEYMIVKSTEAKEKIQNIIFAAIQKPDIVLTDALNNNVQISVDGKRFVKGKLHLMSHGYLNFVLMSVLPSLWHNKVSYAIINYLEDKFIVTGGEGCRVGKLSGAKSIPPRSFSKRTFKNLFWICCGCRQDLCYAGGRSPGSKQRDRRCCGLH